MAVTHGGATPRILILVLTETFTTAVLPRGGHSQESSVAPLAAAIRSAAPEGSCPDPRNGHCSTAAASADASAAARALDEDTRTLAASAKARQNRADNASSDRMMAHPNPWSWPKRHRDKLRGMQNQLM